MFLFPSLFLFPGSVLLSLILSPTLFYLYIFFGGCCLNILKKQGWKTKIVLGGRDCMWLRMVNEGGLFGFF